MTRQERRNRMVFWILKRHTSYTAWERVYSVFEAQYKAMENQRPRLRNPDARYGTGYGVWSDWPTWRLMSMIRKEMRERLQRLRQGDKNVLAYYEAVQGKTFEELLRTFVDEAYYALVGIHPHDGWMGKHSEPHFPDEKNIVTLAERSAKLYKENIEIPRLQHLKFSRYNPVNLNWGDDYGYSAIASPPRGSCHGDAYTVYPIPDDLPPLPEPVLFSHKPPPWWAPKKQLSGPHVVKSGEWLAYPGIYLCGPDDGLLYSPGTWAPYRYSLAPGNTPPIPTEWTLIWLDDRYRDGAPIPEEEKLYFPPEPEEREPVKAESARAMPGEPCPRSGI